MSKSSERVKAWRKATKQRMVAAMGGKCQCCGYNRCMGSLDFHHINPEEKEMALGSITANPKEWGVIVNELRKCILICRNCHGELHYGEREMPETYARFDERYADYKAHSELTNPCPHCGTPKADHLQFCSLSCGATARHAVPVDWTPFNLEELIKTNSASQIADMIGVSLAAVVSRIRRAGGIVPRKSQKLERDFTPYVKPSKVAPVKISDIDPDWRSKPNLKNRTVEWPSKEVLEKLVWEKSMVQIGEDYGVWDNTVRKWAKSYGIDCPPQGYWQRRERGYSHEEALVSQKRMPPTARKKMSLETARQAFAMRQEGKSYREIGDTLGFGHWTIQQALRRYGLEEMAAQVGDDPTSHGGHPASSS